MEASQISSIPLRDGEDRVITENLSAACEKLIEMGVRRWAVIHMPELSCGLERGGRFTLEESWQIPADFIKSSVGAGDAFASGILYGAYHNWSLERSIHIAGAIGAYSLSGDGACDSIIALSELIRDMERMPRLRISP